jgi:hypothetical protein
MTEFVIKHVLPGMKVAEIGAYNVNGTFRPLFAHCHYVGLDIVAGPNVDRVVAQYDFGKDEFDAVVSGSTMEHVEDIYAWAQAVVALAVPGGLVCVIAPHTWGEHKHPLDCWRILPDGMRWLFVKKLGVAELECRAGETDTIFMGRLPLA